MTKILLVDDDISINKAITEVLVAHDYEVISVENAEQGLMQLKQAMPDLMITDIVMPNMDGLEFLKSIRSAIGNYPCKIIVISGGGRIGGEVYLEVAKALGVDDILEKPFGMNDLLKSVRKLLS